MRLRTRFVASIVALTALAAVGLYYRSAVDDSGDEPPAPHAETRSVE